MQKKLLWLFIPIGLIVLSRILTLPNAKKNAIQVPTPGPQKNITHILKKSIFVPYWAPEVHKEDSSYDSYYYFGIVPTKEGAIENEVGYQKIHTIDTLAEKQKKIVLRMLDSSVTEVLLQDKTAQKTLISGVKSILSRNAFSGLILDIEVPFTLQPNKKEQITQFVQLMCTAIKSDYKTCGVLIYGDFSFRDRPYDLKALGSAADTIYLMAYDFHKAGGEPGPNFSFEEKQKYGYDFKTMIQDATSLVPKDKIEVVFGMYGYDWTMNEQGTPLKSAVALSDKNIQLKVQSLKLKIESNEAKEKNVEYVDEEGKKHVIWYEDEESVAIKIKYLQSQGVWQTSFWALSYF